MERRSIMLVFLVEFAVCIYAEQIEAGLKCTPGDRRQLYPNCMLYSVDRTLWCDQSNYSKVPGIDVINKYLPGGDCRVATALYVNDSCITKLSRGDLYGFTDITIFCGQQNMIAELSGAIFKYNGKLIAINLRMNRIESIGPSTFEGLKKLETLDLESNFISIVEGGAFRDLTSLGKLILSDNRMHVLNEGLLHSLGELRELHITGNRISYIEERTFYGLRSLTHLHLDGNRIREIAFSHFKYLKNLEVLTISHNRIATWPPQYGVFFTSLHTLDLGHNMISEFGPMHLRNMSKLQNLSLENNSLRNVEEAQFQTTPRLIYLNMGQNYIEDIPMNTFKDLCNLKHIVLRKNHMKTPRPEWFQRLVESEDVGDQTDVADNKWECDCDITKYREFLLKLRGGSFAETSSWDSKLDVVCYSPRQFQDEKLSEIYDYEFGVMGCEETMSGPTRSTMEAKPSPNCTTEGQFSTLPIKLYQPFKPRAVPIHQSAEIPEKRMPFSVFWAVIISVVVFVCFMALVIVALWCRYGGVRHRVKRGSKARKSESAEPCMKGVNEEALSNREDVFVEA